MITEEKINEVFKSRDKLDPRRYIPRKTSETRLRRMIANNRFVFLCGESGCGKTWLIQYLLNTEKYAYKYINLSEVAFEKSFGNYFLKQQPELKRGRTEGKKAGGSALAVSGELSSVNSFQINTDLLWKFFEANADRLIVLDNFESILDEEVILKEFSCLVTMADDPRMIMYNPKFVILGAIRDIREYYQRMPNYQTIASRISSCVLSGFNDTECRDYVKKSFDLCGFTQTDYTGISERIFKLTEGIPQMINELGYQIAIRSFDEKQEKIDHKGEGFHQAELQWISEKMRPEYELLHSLFLSNIRNRIELNDILFAMQKFTFREFSSSELFSVISAEFGEKEKITPRQVKGYLEKLAAEDGSRNLLLQSNPDGFKIKTVKTRACLDIILDVKDNTVICDDLEELSLL